MRKAENWQIGCVVRILTRLDRFVDIYSDVENLISYCFSFSELLTMAKDKQLERILTANLLVYPAAFKSTNKTSVKETRSTAYRYHPMMRSGICLYTARIV